MMHRTFSMRSSMRVQRRGGLEASSSISLAHPRPAAVAAAVVLPCKRPGFRSRPPDSSPPASRRMGRQRPRRANSTPRVACRTSRCVRPACRGLCRSTRACQRRAKLRPQATALSPPRPGSGSTSTAASRAPCAAPRPPRASPQGAPAPCALRLAPWLCALRPVVRRTKDVSVQMLRVDGPEDYAKPPRRYGGHPADGPGVLSR
mmetsp:Transcript_69413/g.226048  ORF Transcript_69413/g.226048 Transcript_69413/m.226048 type:complete len:204 (-) Transcript_69413:131-742(-)